MKYGFPSLGNIKTRESYVTSYDPRTRTASWVIERLNPASLSGLSDRKYCEFKEDDRCDRNRAGKVHVHISVLPPGCQTQGTWARTGPHEVRAGLAFLQLLLRCCKNPTVRAELQINEATGEEGRSSLPVKLFEFLTCNICFHSLAAFMFSTERPMPTTRGAGSTGATWPQQPTTSGTRKPWTTRST